MSDKSIYQFEVQRLNGETISLSEYRNKVLLIVNTASECGFTPQLENLEHLRQLVGSEDFEILAFPSNDFGGQEPLEGSAIGKFCKMNFHTKYPVFDKIHVRGAKAHPLYKFLAARRQNGRNSASPRWNFHKYLINREGEVEDYYYPFTKPDSGRIVKRIQRLLDLMPVLQ
ncbi:glutathione peroxidase [Hufsiella ginkgonis]|uniref:Glutathione peroxidase n=1 Tax=Hufsiella ginkgonis TaxID=2695274 RepID=A0A7K1XXW1_9SPHI|nr:glutathione peroxidase [Hufsiella ginkgonis]MXV15830.1 glutathione peroxidase [Hufsiella ginkgonis]